MDEIFPDDAGNGRFAPSPTGDFHLGNLRTALLAWALARCSERGFIIRMEDLDERSRPHFATAQLEALEAMGIDWDGPVTYQSERLEIYAEAVDELRQRGLLYECYCTRRELAEAPSAPHQPPGSYPGTCRNLTPDERSERLARLTNRGAALRLASETGELGVVDDVCGPYTGTVDDFVIQRGDGVYSYNFVSVLDDALQNVTQVVRGDDLLPSTPRQVYLQRVLGVPTPHYAHVPMMFNAQGVRLAKRDGAVTLPQLREYGWADADVLEFLGCTLGMDHPRSGEDFLAQLGDISLAQEPYLVDVERLREGPRAVLR